MANESRMNLKILFEILTDNEVEELKERAVRQQSFYAADLLRWEAEERSQAMAKPVHSPFVRCKDARVMLGGRCILERCERAGWLTPVRRGKRLTLFKRGDIESRATEDLVGRVALNWGFFLQFSNYVVSIGLPITNHFSPVTLRRASLAQDGPHLSPISSH